MRPAPTTVFVWDFDGTLADTRLRNYRIVRRLLAEATDGVLERFPALATPETYERVVRGYANWRDLYTREFAFSEAETDRLGSLWAAYQLADEAPVPVFAGLAEVIQSVTGAAHGVVSQNARAQILRTLEAADLGAWFGAVVGYEDVDLTRQKPAPDGVLACVAALAPAVPWRVVCVGDHETDVRCGRNAARVLAERGTPTTVISIAVRFVDGDDPAGWAARPDHVADTPADLLRIVHDLLPPPSA